VIDLPVGIGAPSLAVLALVAFRTWWRGRIHQKNVDRVCTSHERQAKYGHPVGDAGRALEAVRPQSLATFRQTTKDD
jgi:hypothetical protein